jgi:lipoate-protein ligase A
MPTWRMLSEDGVTASAGLAVDEALMAGYARGAPPRPPTVRLYTYRTHCALVGRYQNLEAELDLEVCRETGTEIGRRPTGGGAIVMGAGQLGVAVVTRAPAGERPKELLLRHAAGIVAGLADLGIGAAFGGKNDLVVAGRKIAGLGLYLDAEGALLFHASVLADLDVGFMLRVLRIPAAKLGDKGITAVEDRVTTVTRELGEPWTGARLRPVVARGFETALGVCLEEAVVEPGEARRARGIARDKHEDRSWLFQRSPHPDATATSVVKTPGGLVRVYVAANGRVVKSVLFAGDFNELPEPLTRLEAALRWAPLDPAELRSRSLAACASGTGLGVPADVLADAVVEAGGRARGREVAAPIRPEGSCYFPGGR